MYVGMGVCGQTKSDFEACTNNMGYANQNKPASSLTWPKSMPVYVFVCVYVCVCVSQRERERARARPEFKLSSVMLKASPEKLRSLRRDNNLEEPVKLRGGAGQQGFNVIVLVHIRKANVESIVQDASGFQFMYTSFKIL